MVKLLQSPWLTALVGAVTFTGTLGLCWKQLPTHTPAETPHETPVQGSGFTLTSNPEIDLLIADLQTRKRELDAREQQLHDLEVRLQAEAAELRAVTQEVARLQTAFDTAVLRIQAEESDNLKRLAKTYSAMSAEAAADILRRLDDHGIVKILVYMKEEETARILEALAAGGEANLKRVADLSETLRMTLYRQAPNNG